MKKVILIILFLMVTSCLYAEDIDLGKIEMTKNQIQRMSYINGSLDGVVKGLSHREDGRIIVVVTRFLTDSEKETLGKNIKKLPDIEIPKEKSEIELLKERVEKLEKK